MRVMTCPTAARAAQSVPLVTAPSRTPEEVARKVGIAPHWHTGSALAHAGAWGGCSYAQSSAAYRHTYILRVLRVRVLACVDYAGAAVGELEAQGEYADHATPLSPALSVSAAIRVAPYKRPEQVHQKHVHPPALRAPDVPHGNVPPSRQAQRRLQYERAADNAAGHGFCSKVPTDSQLRKRVIDIQPR